MRRRRLPTGGLVSLAVVLAALAVVVVAGAPTPRTRVVVEQRTHTIWRTTTRGVSERVPRRPHRATRERARAYAVVAHDGSTGARRPPEGHVAAPAPPEPTTSPTATTTTTTTTGPPATTTTTVPAPAAAPAPTSRDGVFEGGATSASARVDAVHAVTVVVPAGIQVSLSVVCGLATWSTTSMTKATVHVLSGGAACTATFSIPTSAPQPARWRLTTA